MPTNTYWNKLLGEEFMTRLASFYPQEVHRCLKKDDIPNTNNNQNITAFIQNAKATVDIRTVQDAIHNEVFSNYYLKLIAAVSGQMKEQNLPFYQDETVKTEFLMYVHRKIQLFSTRVLIQEMYYCKQQGDLVGDTPKEEYDYFNDVILKRAEYWEHLLTSYPYLFELIMETISQVTDNIQEVTERLNHDKETIIRQFCGGKTFRKIRKIESGISDLHKNGKGVLKLYLDNDQIVVYKPRSLKNEAVFYEILEYLLSAAGLKGYAPSMITINDYGWSSYISYRECCTKEELGRYYTRMGVILFLTYLFGTSDLHSENLIASGEYPVFIDMETLIGGTDWSKGETADESAAMLLKNSVLYQGILPFYLWDSHGQGINISAISGAGGQKMPVKTPRIINERTSDMRVVYEYPTSGKSQNLACINGKFIPPDQFRWEITYGFRKAFQYAVEHKEELTEMVDKLMPVDVRTLIANTQFYSMLLQSSYHPDFMSDSADRKLFLLSIFKYRNIEDEGWRQIAECEIHEMLRGDIPYFYYNSKERHLYNSEEDMVLSEYVPYVMEDILKDRIRGLSLEDMKRQINFISISFELAANRSDQEKNSYYKDIFVNRPPKTQTAVDLEMTGLAEQIGEKLLAEAIYNQTYTEVTWLGGQVVGNREEHWGIGQVDRYLYAGLSGILLFFHALKKAVPKMAYRNICKIMDGMLFQYTEQLCHQVGLKQELSGNASGAYTGESSIVYTYQALYCITGEERYLTYAKKHCSVLKSCMKADIYYDLMQGNAGAGIVLLNMYELTGERVYLEMAEEAAGYLLGGALQTEHGLCWKIEAAGQPLAGFSHGNSGMLLFFCRLASITGFPKYEIASAQILSYENSIYDREMNNWLDLRGKTEEKDRGKEAVAWCHGSAGVLLSRISVLDYVKGELKRKVQEDISRALKKTKEYAVRQGMCLCHGSIGNIEILNIYAKKTDDKELSILCRQWTANLTTQIADGQMELLMQEKISPGLMLGCAGTGYSVLTHVLDWLPEVLCLSLGTRNNI